MILKSLTVTNFKSYEKAQFSFSPGVNIIHGNNGAGKTNLLDAIYLLSMTKSYFNIPDQKLIRENSLFYRLDGIILKHGETERIVCKCPLGKSKTLEKNGMVYDKLAKHMGVMPVVMIAPDDVQLINGPSMTRLRFLDSTLAQIDTHYLSHLILHNRLLKQRNALLKMSQKRGKVDLALLQSYDTKMSPLVDVLYQKRKLFFKRFETLLETHYHEISGGLERVTCTYVSQLDQSSLLELASLNQAREVALGRTIFGIHKDRISFSLDNHPMKLFASQGQKKSFIFALKLAQFQYLSQYLDERPLLLLDDIFDRLDLDRIKRLASIVLKPTFGQVFVTDTQKSRMLPLLEEVETVHASFLITKKVHANEEE